MNNEEKILKMLEELTGEVKEIREEQKLMRADIAELKVGQKSLENRMDQMEENQISMLHRMDQMEENQSSMLHRMDRMEENQSSMLQRMNEMEENLTQAIREVVQEVSVIVEEAGAQMDELQNQVNGLTTITMQNSMDIQLLRGIVNRKQ